MLRGLRLLFITVAAAHCGGRSALPSPGPSAAWFEGTITFTNGRSCQIAPGRERCDGYVTDLVRGVQCGPGQSQPMPTLRNETAPLRTAPTYRPRRTGREYVVGGRPCTEWSLSTSGGGQVRSCRDKV